MKYDILADQATISRTADALRARRYSVYEVIDKASALQKIKELIPVGASVMNGSSRTLEEIGFVEFLKAGQHGWNNLHAAILAEKDPAKQALLRKQAVLSDFYLGSMSALTQEGEFVFGSKSGSQLPHIVYTSPNLIFVVGVQKMVPTLDDARARLRDYVVPLEEQNMQQKYGAHTGLMKELIFHGESETSARKVNIILVNEKLGF